MTYFTVLRLHHSPFVHLKLAELSPRTSRTFRRELSSLEWTFSRWRTPGNVFLSPRPIAKLVSPSF